MKRRERQIEINAKPGDRAALETQYGQVWDAEQLRQHFDVIGYWAPFCVARRDGVKGSLEFQHHPRFYFNWKAYE